MPAARRRHFGSIRQRASGRFQARYRGPDGKLRSAPRTFERTTDAARWLTLKEAEITRGDWLDPDAAKVAFTDYAEQWINDRVLKARTQELYRGLLQHHLMPAFGHLALADIDEASVRRWRKERLSSGPHAARPFGPVTVAKAYRLLHAILATAADDQIIRRNPCRIENASKEDHPNGRSPRCPSSSPSRKPSRLATGCLCSWLRSPGFAGANSLPCAATASTSTPARSGSLRQPPSSTGGLRPDTPKSRAGRRTVAFPADLVPELRRHLDRFAEPGPNGLVFIGPKGAALRRNNFRRIWVRACAAAGAPGVHFHDLRHTGGTLAAATGATLKELMARLGHSSPRAAMIYQHATSDRDQAIAQALGTLARQARESQGK